MQILENKYSAQVRYKPEVLGVVWGLVFGEGSNIESYSAPKP